MPSTSSPTSSQSRETSWSGVSERTSRGRHGWRSFLPTLPGARKLLHTLALKLVEMPLGPLILRVMFSPITALALAAAALQGIVFKFAEAVTTFAREQEFEPFGLDAVEAFTPWVDNPPDAPDPPAMISDPVDTVIKEPMARLQRALQQMANAALVTLWGLVQLAVLLVFSFMKIAASLVGSSRAAARAGRGCGLRYSRSTSGRSRRSCGTRSEVGCHAANPRCAKPEATTSARSSCPAFRRSRTWIGAMHRPCRTHTGFRCSSNSARCGSRGSRRRAGTTATSASGGGSGIQDENNWGLVQYAETLDALLRVASRLLQILIWTGTLAEKTAIELLKRARISVEDPTASFETGVDVATLLLVKAPIVALESFELWEVHDRAPRRIEKLYQ